MPKDKNKEPEMAYTYQVVTEEKKPDVVPCDGVTLEDGVAAFWEDVDGEDEEGRLIVAYAPGNWKMIAAEEEDSDDD